MKWIKKPIVVEAEQYKEYGKLVKGMCNSVSCYTQGNDKPHVHTIHNNQIVLLEVGDYIIPEPDGEHYYPCKPDIFEKTYSLFDESINQEGSLKDSDWKEQFKEWLTDNTQRISNPDLSNAYKGGAIEAGNYLGKNVIAPLLQNECKGDDLVARVQEDSSPIVSHPSGSSNSDEHGEETICPVTKKRCDDECCHAVVEIKCHQKAVATNTNDPFIQKHLTRIKNKIKETTEWWEANRDKPLYVQCLPSDKDAFNIPNSNLWLRRTVFVFEDLQVPNTSSQTLTQIEQDKKQPLYTELFLGDEGNTMTINCFDEDSEMSIVIRDNGRKCIYSMSTWEVQKVCEYLNLHLNNSVGQDKKFNK